MIIPGKTSSATLLVIVAVIICAFTQAGTAVPDKGISSIPSSIQQVFPSFVSPASPGQVYSLQPFPFHLSQLKYLQNMHQTGLLLDTILTNPGQNQP